MKEKTNQALRVVSVFIIVLTIAMFWYDQIMFYSYYLFDDEYETYCPKESNIALIKVQGEIVSYQDWYGYEDGFSYDIVSSEKIVEHIENAGNREHINAIIIEIDSYGGGLVASEEIMKALKRSEKLTIAVIRESAVSGGYLIATGADKIYASEMSEIGGIGVTMSYLDYSQVQKKEGIIYQELSSAKYKDTGHPDKELTEEERELLMRDIIKAHEIFVRKIVENRNIEIEEVEKLADGFTMLAESAKENGLIDEFGGVYEVKKWIGNKLKINPEICVY